MSNKEKYITPFDPYHDPVLTKESKKMYQSSKEVEEAGQILLNSIREFASELRHGEVGYAEHLNTTDGFEKFLQEVEGNVNKLIHLIYGED